MIKRVAYKGNTVPSIIKGSTAAISCALFSTTNFALADNDLQFRPTKLEAKFYEIGFRKPNKEAFQIILNESR